MDSVELNIIEDSNRGRWNQNMGSLKSSVFPTMTFGASKTMEPKLHEAVVAGDIDAFIERLRSFMFEKQLAANVILEQPSPIGNTLLHVAADSGKFEITKLLAHHFPNLLTMTNYQGDTALHLAARARKLEKTNHRVDTAPRPYLAGARAHEMLETVKVLVSIAKTLPPPRSNDGTFLRMKNEKGNTALHEAVLQERHEVAYFLTQEDHEAAYYVNNDGKSPLYLAAELPSKDMMTLLLEEIGTDCYEVLVQKLNGEKSPVYAALLHKNLDMLTEIVNKKPELLHYIDKEGKSPIHYAASIGHVEGVNFLLKENQEGALVWDNYGFYPIHEACKNGHVEVVRLLLGLWSDPGEFLTREEGRNIFHVAAESGEETVVKYLLRSRKLADFVEELVNQKDKKGNTPLHLATLHARYMVVFRLVENRNVDTNLKNGENMTAYDLAVEQSRIADSESSGKPKLEAKLIKTTESEVQDHKTLMVEDHQKESTFLGWKLRGSYQRMTTLSILQYAPRAILSGKPRIQPPTPMSKKEVSESIKSLMVVATLVASATFSAQVSLSTGDSKKEKATENYRLAFVISNTLAMNMAIIAAIILCWAQKADVNIGSTAVWFVSWIVGVSLYLLCIAFIAAVLIASAEYTTFPRIFIVIQSMFLFWHMMALFPLIMPSFIRQILGRRFYWVSFSVYYYVVSLKKRFASKKQQEVYQQS